MITLQEKFNVYYNQLEEAARSPDELKKRFCEMNGFNLNGDGWIVLGNTYPIKDELKKKGARFNGELKHWILPVEDKKYSLYKISADDLFEKDRFSGIWDYRSLKDTSYLIAELKNKDEAIVKADLEKSDPGMAPRTKLSAIYTVGAKVNIDIKSMQLKSTGVSAFGPYYLYEIIDLAGYQFIWYSSRELDLSLEPSRLIGTIKDFKEYYGIEQCILTRCKIVEYKKDSSAIMPDWSRTIDTPSKETKIKSTAGTPDTPVAMPNSFKVGLDFFES